MLDSHEFIELAVTSFASMRIASHLPAQGFAVPSGARSALGIVALAAELSPGAIYYYFAGIDEIYAEICEEAFQLIEQSLERESERAATPRRKLENMVSAFLQHYRDHPDYFDLFAFSDLGWRRVGLRKELRERIDQRLNRAIELFRGVIEQGIRDGEIASDYDSRRLAFALWAGIEGVVFLDRRSLLEEAEFSVEQLVQTQMHTILGRKDVAATSRLSKLPATPVRRRKRS